MSTTQHQRIAWRGMYVNLGISTADMHRILSELYGAHQRLARDLHEADSTVSAWTITRHVLRTVSQWNWARNEWPYLASKRLEQWIAQKDMELGLHAAAPIEPPVLRKRKHNVDDGYYNPNAKIKTALMILADACEEARNALV